jgi:WD40 repeat protein/serine/threonine protein kinase
VPNSVGRIGNIGNPSYRKKDTPVDREASVDDLVGRWQQLQRQGQSISAEELCADCPENLADLKARLCEVASMQAFLQLSQDGDGAGEPVRNDSDTILGNPGSKPDLPTTAEPLPLISGYEILKELGRGGMGIVYKARQISLKRLVALKTILADGRAGSDQRARFRAEAQAAARLQHPNIVQIFEIGEHQGRPFFSMEYVDGTSLAQHLAGSLLLPPQAAGLMAQLADAVHLAHQQGVIHRDLKPANVLLPDIGVRSEETGGKTNSRQTSSPQSSLRAPHSFVPKITDFGLAKQLQDDSGLTQSGAILGTPSYMAPEQARGETREIGPAADVYALGAILYETLTGRPPFRGATLVDTLNQVRQVEPVPPSRLQATVPRDLEVICLKCLRKEPAKRYASAAELAEDLRRFLRGEPIRARAVGWPERAWRRCRRNPVVAGLLATVALSVLAGIAGVLHYAFRADASAHEAHEAQGIAQERAARLRLSLIRQQIAAGTHLLEAGDLAQGLWRYAHAWELDAADPDTQASHRLRLGFALQTGPQLVGVCMHRRPVLDAVFDPAGKTVLTRTDERQAYLWDPYLGRLIAPPLAHDGDVSAAFFHPSGEQVATGSADGFVQLWDARSGQLLRTLPQEAPVHALAYRPDGTLLAVATQTGVVRFWDPATGRPGAPDLALSAEVYHVAFSPNGRQVVTADAGHVARVWDLATGQAVTAPLPHDDQRPLNEYAISYRCWPVFSPDGKSVATVHPNRRKTAQPIVWDLATGKPRYTLAEQTYFVRQLKFNPDGSRLVVLCGDEGSLFDAASGKVVRYLGHPREAPHACFRPDGLVLATCSTGGLIHLWDTRTGAEVEERLRCADGVHALAFSPDGQHLLAASHDGTARVWRRQTAAGGGRYAHDCGHADRVPFPTGDEQVRFSPDGRRVMYYGGPKGARLRDSAGAGAEVPLEHSAPVHLTRFSPDGQRVLTQDRRATLRWWHATTGQPAAPEVPLQAVLDDLGHGIGISADGRRLLTVEPGPRRVVTVWNVESGRPLLGPLREWNPGPQRYGKPGLLGQISQAALSPDGTRLVLASDAAGMLGLWDVDAGKELARTQAYHGEVYQITFSADGQRYLTNASDGVARLWQTATGAPAGPPLRHPSFCRKADLSPDGWRVATVDAANTLRLWDGRTGDLFGRVPARFKDKRLWFSRDGGRLVIGGGGQVVELRAYSGTAEDLPTLLRLLTGLQRNPDETIGPVDLEIFRSDPDSYQGAWQAWRSQNDATRRAAE